MLVKCLIFFSLVCTLSSCVDNHSNKSAPSESDSTEAPLQDAAGGKIQSIDSTMYAIQLPLRTLYLQQWDSTINVEQQLGRPVTENQKKLDNNADTSPGAFIKDQIYDGLQLKWFSPPQNGKSFWLQEDILTDNKYKTTKGITIGDSFEKVNLAYPSLQPFPGASQNIFYIAEKGYEKSMEMEFENKKLVKLRMYCWGD